MSPFLRSYADLDLQQPMDAAVVIPTLLRPNLQNALRSVFAQDFGGRIHILIGIDQLDGNPDLLDAVCVERPSHCVVQAYWPGYSTSRRHGGLAMAGDGGALRCILSHLANSPYVTYLDDDNWWASDHLRQMRAAISQAEWSFALRWFVHPESCRTVCVDSWESLGPGKGVFKERFGGFVDPNCLMINKLECPSAISYWNFPLPASDLTADRRVFDFLLRHHRGCGTGQPSVYYKMNDQDGLHEKRLKVMGQTYIDAGLNRPGSARGVLV